MTASKYKACSLIFLKRSAKFDMNLIYKLKQNGISEKLLNITKDFLDLRKHSVVLSEQYSFWANITAEVSQGSILGPLFFLIYINDL